MEVRFASAKGKKQSRFDSYSVKNSVLSHVNFWDCLVRQPFSARNNCILRYHPP